VLALQRLFPAERPRPRISHTTIGAPRRAEAETFIADIFARFHGAQVSQFAPNLMLVDEEARLTAAAGWRGAGEERLFLETYLDAPIETAVARLAGQPVRREAIVEVGNLAADRPGASIEVILSLARHLDALGYEWVVFTATHQLISIFRRLGLAPLALAPADPARLGAQAANWGSYYDSRLGVDKANRHE
jgi:hypothetical protein